MRRDRALLGLVLLGFGFFALFGPVYVALPLHVSGDHASAATLGLYYTVFGGGAVLGGLAAGYLRSRLWPVSAAIVVAFGVTLLPLGLGASFFAVLALCRLPTTQRLCISIGADPTGYFSQELCQKPR